jgi:histidine ammonia-lyase
VIGVLADCLTFARDLIETEINSSNDNPLLDPDTGDVLHGGNFYGGHPCMAMDMLKIAVANIADLIDRQMVLLCNPHTNSGLPADLVAPRGPDQVSHHGFKAMQITASALTAEALKLTMPASVFSRSTESHNQDKVSMGTIAARDALRIIELTETTLAIVQLALCQAFDLRSGQGCHHRSRELHQAIRRIVPMNTADRRQDVDIQSVLELYRAKELPIGAIDFPAE